MNWNRIGLKNMAKTALKGNFWLTVLVAFIFALPGASRSVTTVRDGYEVYTNINYGVVATAAAGGGTISLLLRIFLFNPLGVGCRRFFVENLYKPAEVEFVKAGFVPNYVNVVLTLAIRDIFVFLWTLLLVVPGIIKAYEYRMVDFLLADYPDMPYKEALERSKQMMMGEKMDAFILDLSFIPWYFTALFTFGLSIIFYVNPYQAETNAALYAALQDKMQKMYGNGDM